MEVKVHDIVKFNNLDQLEPISVIPEWVYDAQSAANYGVVRRMPVSNQLIPIGLRGNSREQRFGTFIHENHVVEVITPNSLVNRIDRFNNKFYYPILNEIRDQFQKFDLIWGPTGSIGFEIATSINVTTGKSDIDLSIYVDSIEESLLEEVGKCLNGFSKPIDVQVEVPNIGAFLLKDYLSNKDQGFIVRTAFGPHLCRIKDSKIKILQA
ncbi:malonate decarboxylase holo-ACP synthase [Ureibacillus sp. 179-F W5.1 NHS]|uniref:Malonate decarboxylase holo-ACP synthase n=1 Tax=Lysinibacillus halotolerans TaxID=1368476 RepID=A0A3M8H634_9BACI|nr:malonate decarboxylase holo-ACP synthase [Lysinibacillus halotolerans]RNC97875.1 malonate decarboxylase holo-ACP synthase [Lysinibacillus halotolerans]